MNKISVNLPPEILKRLKEEREVDKYLSKSVTTIIHEALAMYFLRKDLERGLPRTEVMLRNQPLSVAQYPVPVSECIPLEPIEEPTQTGIIMPNMTKTRVRPDPSIKHVSLFAHEIKPGPGVTNRLIAAGITPIDIVKAKRNRAAGRDWDKSLEQYFDLL